MEIFKALWERFRAFLQTRCASCGRRLNSFYPDSQKCGSQCYRCAVDGRLRFYCQDDDVIPAYALNPKTR
jgi:hypothetical protein